MAKRVFFSFQYQDIFRANVVRNHWLTKADRGSAGFFDSSLWEEAKRKGYLALKRLINGGLEGTSVTCVLIGSDTFARPWVRYEILKSLKRGNSVLAIHVNSIKPSRALGPNPLEYVGISFSDSGLTATLYELVNHQWQEYREIDDGASYRIDAVAQRYRGQGYNLTEWCPVYDW